MNTRVAEVSPMSRRRLSISAHRLLSVMPSRRAIVSIASHICGSSRMLVRRPPTVTFRLSRIEDLSSDADKFGPTILSWRESRRLSSRYVSNATDLWPMQPFNV
ncbi:hypothetical protein GCM10017083_10590 [Thalassobaculum fulvum]|uniref:Uncharacterized protein n=1 Tax=Thalassobaculum fulvum TaxID=1633335 RepID=A0A918XQB2_9PROT|nr:hypothetical protein GCM10017083_10590 [Thalassobaculum fulvum]